MPKGNGKRGAMVPHRFFCINCGAEGIPIYRRVSRQYAAGHRKKLFCPWCKEMVNHIECITDEDVKQFKEDFEEGVYKDEAEESLLACRSTWQR